MHDLKTFCLLKYVAYAHKMRINTSAF